MLSIGIMSEKRPGLKIEKQIKPIGRLLRARSDGTLIVLVVFNNPGEGEKGL